MTNVTIRSYREKAGDKEKICDFLIRINRFAAASPHYSWARWAWQFGPYMNLENVSHMGLAEADGEVVAIAVYESDIGESYFCFDPAYGHLKAPMMDYAMEHLHCEGKLKLLLPDGDLEFQQAAARRGFFPTVEKETTARFEGGSLAYTLPEGYFIMDFSDSRFDPDRYYNAIWRGFNNQRQRNARELEAMKNRNEFHDLHWDNSLRILVVSPSGDYAAHCGMWYLPGDPYANVEPVFTLPEYRRMGLGKAAVLEGIKRCQLRGANWAYVGSSQQFYYSIGFAPYRTDSWWKNNLQRGNDIL